MVEERLKKRVLQGAVAIAIIGSIVVNILANALPINGKLTAEVSDSLPDLFAPAGFTFSIWGIIYLLLLVFVAYQARDFFKKDKVEMPFLNRIGLFVIIGSIANAVWIFLWHYENIFGSLLMMVVLFVSLLLIHQRLHKNALQSKSEFWCVWVPFSVYFGWISVASVANVTAWLVSVGWDGFGIANTTWMILILVVVFVLGMVVLLREADVAYTLVFVWALFGIASKRLATDPVFGVQSNIAYLAIAFAVLLVAGILFSVFVKKSCPLRKLK